MKETESYYLEAVRLAGIVLKIDALHQPDDKGGCLGCRFAGGIRSIHNCPTRHILDGESR